MTSLSIINEIEIATPCPADWEQMLGDDKVRFCGQCEKHVYNFSAMTAAQIGEVIEETEGVFCGRLYRRADGTVLTADCPVGLAEKARLAARRAARRGLAFAGLLGVSLISGAAGFFSKGAQCSIEQVKPIITDWSDDHVAGGMMVEPPVQPHVEPTPQPQVRRPVAGRIQVRGPKMGEIKAPPQR